MMPAKCRIDIRLDPKAIDMLDDLLRELFYSKEIKRASRGEAVQWLITQNVDWSPKDEQ